VPRCQGLRHRYRDGSAWSFPFTTFILATSSALTAGRPFRDLYHYPEQPSDQFSTLLPRKLPMYRPGASTRAQSSAASSPRTNPLRSNNDREDNGDRRRASYEPANSSRRPLGDSSSELSASQSWDGDQEVKGQQLNKMIGV